MCVWVWVWVWVCGCVWVWVWGPATGQGRWDWSARHKRRRGVGAPKLKAAPNAALWGPTGPATLLPSPPATVVHTCTPHPAVQGQQLHKGSVRAQGSAQAVDRNEPFHCASH
jgi:hypothetical protein